MYIILMRHGEAEPETPDISNKQRRLTGKGRKNAERTAKMLSRFLKGNELRILTSPYRRTRETAEIVTETCGGKLEAAEELLQSAWGPVASHCVMEGGPLLFVSHHPFLQSWLMTICGAAIKFDPAAAAVIDYDAQWRKGKVIGYLTPELRKLKEE